MVETDLRLYKRLTELIITFRQLKVMLEINNPYNDITGFFTRRLNSITLSKYLPLYLKGHISHLMRLHVTQAIKENNKPLIFSVLEEIIDYIKLERIFTCDYSFLNVDSRNGVILTTDPIIKALKIELLLLMKKDICRVFKTDTSYSLSSLFKKYRDKKVFDRKINIIDNRIKTLKSTTCYKNDDLDIFGQTK